MRTAIGFLTRIPVRDTRPMTPERLGRAAFWFPAVGLIVGGLMGGTYLLADLALPAGPSVVLALFVAVLATGGFHEDGLADAADAAGAHVTQARKLEILRDSRIGTYGGLAVAFALLFPYSVLVGLDGEQVLRAALAGHVLGRWAGLPQALLLPPARPEGSGTLLSPTPAVCLAASAYTAAIVLIAGGLAAGAVALAAGIAVCALTGWLSVRIFGGVSGDTFGASNKLVELTTYAALAAMWAQ